MTSQTTASGGDPVARSSASSPRDAVSIANPSSRKLTSSSRTITGSSSTSNTRDAGLDTDGGYSAGRGGPIHSDGNAPVAQRIERRPPEPEAQVRVLSGAP